MLQISVAAAHVCGSEVGVALRPRAMGLIHPQAHIVLRLAQLELLGEARGELLHEARGAVGAAHGELQLAEVGEDLSEVVVSLLLEGALGLGHLDAAMRDGEEVKQLPRDGCSPTPETLSARAWWSVQLRGAPTQYNPNPNLTLTLTLTLTL